jgi:hypothetical protein
MDSNRVTAYLSGNYARFRRVITIITQIILRTFTTLKNQLALIILITPILIITLISASTLATLMCVMAWWLMCIFGGSITGGTWYGCLGCCAWLMVRSTCPDLSDRPWCVAFSCNGATLACGLYCGVALFDTRSGSKKLELPGALYFSKLVSAFSSHICPSSALLFSLCAFPPLCSPPALFRVQFLLHGCLAYPSLRPAPADAPLTHQILITTGAAKAWPSLPSTQIS